MPKLCPRCGYINKDDAVYCARCGFYLQSVAPYTLPYQPLPREKPPFPYVALILGIGSVMIAALLATIR
ncbi:MAG: zinc ribbon domain-containing protein [Sulfolobus sp.]